jgi:hypothetical protein
MMFNEHCRITKELLGEEFQEVHKWLDEFHGKEPYHTKHRFLRHHKQGIEEVRKIYGDKAALAAKQHVLSDLLGEMGSPTENDIALDGQDYKKRGYW